MSKEAMKLALEAIYSEKVQKSAVILEEALAKQEQGEPVGEMTPRRAEMFMTRFKHEEKMLGPNEQAALDYVIAMLVAKQEQDEPDLDAICQDLQEKTYTQAMRIADLEKDLTVAYIRGHEDGKKAAKQEQGEPVAVVIKESTFDGYLRKGIAWNFRLDSFDIGTRFYTTPQQRKPLTDEQIDDVVSSLTVLSDGYIRFSANLRDFARAIEAAHGIKE